MTSRTTRLAVFLLLALAPARAVRAQSAATGVPDATSGGDCVQATAPAGGGVSSLTGFGPGPLTTLPCTWGTWQPTRPPTLDERMRDWWQHPDRQHVTALRVGLRVADLAASPGTVLVPPFVWAWASATDAAGPVRGARRTTEAVLLGAAATHALKLAFGRARPAVQGRSDDWARWRGIEGGRYQSFPSGHTTVAAAAAATWIAESRGSSAVVAGAATFAVGAGLARLFLDRHWLTDVLAGAAVGTASAVTVQALHRR